jgi:hypothetical protein
MERVPVTIVVAEKYYTFSVCFSSLSYPALKAPAPYYVISVARSVLEYFSTLSHKLHDILQKKKVFEHKMCVFIFFSTVVYIISHCK